MKKPYLLCILDGVGENASAKGNAVLAAHMPFYNSLRETCPRSTLLTHGAAVGLPAGQMGNSEVGHLNIGAGRVLLQYLERIQTDIEEARFEAIPLVADFLKQAENLRAVHLIGLLSDGGVHAHMEHALGVARLLNSRGITTYIHAILDGRDTAPQAALEQLAIFEDAVNYMEHVKIASAVGRFYSMDRDKRWERTEKGYNLMTLARAEYHATTLKEAIEAAYARGEGDEFVEPTTLPALVEGGTIQEGDGLLFFNFRADRMRQIVRCFIDTAFDGFAREKIVRPAAVLTMTDYDATFADRVGVIYPPQKHSGLLGEVVSHAGLTQLRMAETEKYAHVTFFFNGGEETPFNGEDRILVPSPKVRTYDLQPEMSLPELGDKLLAAIEAGTYDMIICNVANGDMVGHTGSLDAARKAMEAVDKFLAKIIPALQAHGGEALITADHGNCEQMIDADGGTHTSHTLNPVPFIYVGRKGATLDNGRLCDIAPTLLGMMNLPKPPEMDGTCLIHFG